MTNNLGVFGDNEIGNLWFGYNPSSTSIIQTPNLFSSIQVEPIITTTIEFNKPDITGNFLVKPELIG